MTATHLQPARLVEQTTSALPTLVATTDCGEVSGRAPHEMATLRFAAHRLAAFFGGEDIGPDSGLVGIGVYWVPSSTLLRSAAAALGIANEMHLWGGIVEAPFIATKLVSHSRPSRRAAAPAGWIDVTGLEECTLPGWSAFGRDDILAAGIDLLGGGDVRLKCPSERGGHGQHVVCGKDDLERWLDTIPPQVLSEGVVLERDLKESVTYSVGFSAFPGGHRIAYVGTQRNVTTAAGNLVYGGSRLDVVRGGWAELETSVDDDTISAAVRAAIRYDSAIREAYGVVASRCNYDVIAGVDEGGRRHLGVLEQSWRFGGASMAELLAIERFAAHPALQRVTAETVETYTDEPIPEAACVYWEGGAGSPRKYARIMEETSAPGWEPC